MIDGGVRVDAASAQRFSALQGDPSNPNLPYDGRFTFARLKYTVASGGYYYRGLPAWAHGYSHAEENLLAITHEVSVLDAHRDGSNVLAIDDPALFKYPVSYMTEGGYWVMSDKEGAALRKYLAQGRLPHSRRHARRLQSRQHGHGEHRGQLSRACSRRFTSSTSRSRIRSFTRSSTSRRSASCRSTTTAAPPVFRGAVRRQRSERSGSLVLLNFNTDVSNFWEFSATGFQPIAGSNEAYKLGVNYLIYALTH